MRSLISGIIGVLLGSLCLLSSLVRGGPQGEGGYFVGQIMGLFMGVLFFFAGAYYAYAGLMELQAGPQGKRRRRTRIDEDDDDRPRKRRRSRNDDDDDDEEDDRPRRKRRSVDHDEDD
jgi:hypothetical protein